MIILCVGQAGCQIGNSIVTLVDNGCYHLNDKYDKQNFPAIFVDTDSKVTRKLQTCRAITKLVKNVNVISGLQTKFKPTFSKDDLFVRDILLHVRDEIIKQNYLCDVIFVHSAIGFTGSALTKILMAEINEKFENVGIVSFTILPFSSGEASFQYYNTMITFNFLKKYCKLCFLIGNDHLMYSQTKAQPSLVDINHASAKAILSILSSKLPTRSKKHLEIETLHQEKNNTDPSITDVLKGHSSSSFLFVALKEFEQNDLMSQKNALVSLSRSCVNYFKLNVFDTSDNKPILQKSFLFANVVDEDQQKKVNLVISCFQKRFQNSLLGNIDVFQGTCAHQRHNCCKLPFFVSCFHSCLMKTYMEFIGMKVVSMLEANAFVYWYGKSKCKGNTKTGNGKEYLEKEYEKFRNLVQSM